MEHYDVKRLALVLAVQAEIEGMKVENMHRQHCGDAPSYGEGEFCSKAGELENLAHAHNEQL
jgi:hypothetical protein